jgi:hypothetical protein
MAAPLPDLDTRSLDELKQLVAQLLARSAALEEENRQLREENTRLKGLPKRPKLAPGGMEQASGPDRPAKARRRGRKRRGGRRTPPVTEERTLRVTVPAGSRRKGYEPYTVQDLLLSTLVIRYRRERWVTPDGRAIIAPLPAEVRGHFGPGIVRFALMQHVQGQVTTERLLAQLRALGVRIAKGQLLALLSARKDDFHGEKDAILEAGLASARWVTVDDTGARHAGRNETTTHIGDERFAWFATRPSKSRLNFLGLLRAGHPDYVINAAAVAYMLERGVPEAIVTALLAHERQGFADEAAWGGHLAALGLGAGWRRLVSEAAMVGAITARGLLNDTVIVSDDAGQFDVLTHALCWVHAERHLRRVACATAEQQRLVDLQRQLVWFSNRVPSVNPSLRSPHPSLARHHPTDPVSGPAIVLSRFEGACAGPMVLSAVGTRPPHDGSSSESAFQCGSRGPRAAATKPTEWPHPRPGRDPSTRPKDGREPMSGSSRAGPPIPRPDDVRPSCSAPGRRPLPSSASRA